MQNKKFTPEKVAKLSATDLVLLWHYDKEHGTSYFKETFSIAETILSNRGMLEFVPNE